MGYYCSFTFYWHQLHNDFDVSVERLESRTTGCFNYVPNVGKWISSHALIVLDAMEGVVDIGDGKFIMRRNGCLYVSCVTAYSHVTHCGYYCEYCYWAKVIGRGDR